MEFTLAQFAPLVGAAFTVHTSHGPFALTLVDASEQPRRGRPAHLRTPLSLLFDGPAGVVLAHDNYRIAHPDLGEHLLNMAPVMSGAGVPGAGPQYEIVFA